MAIPNTREIVTVQNADLNRLVLLQRESVIQLNMAKVVSSFPTLSEVQQLSDCPSTDYCLPERL